MTWSLISCLPDGAIAPVTAAVDARGRLTTIPAVDRLGDLAAVVERWSELAPALRGWDPADGVPLDDARVLAPLRSPRKLICAGANYVNHLRETGVPEERPDVIVEQALALGRGGQVKAGRGPEAAARNGGSGTEGSRS